MTTVLAHGVFDMLHPGHVRHLEEAREMGDRLVVSITGDKFVNKGPGRPVFNEYERRNMLLALKGIDGAVISDNPTAVGVIDEIRPDIFVKGPDYAETGIDPAEQAAVERWGGRVAFTTAATLSSSNLINRHLRPDDQRDCLKALDLDEILGFFEKIKNYKVLVIGENVIDEYIYVLPMGKPPKEAILSCRYQDTKTFLGGGRAVASYLGPFVNTVYFDSSCEKPIIKCRFVDPTTNRKLFEVYYPGDVAPYIKTHVRGYDMVIVADFGHGLIDKRTAKDLSDSTSWLALTCQTNSANFGFNLLTKYPRADYVCVDMHEARLATSEPSAPIREVALDLRLIYPKGVITQGREGCVGWEKTSVYSTPAFADQVVDTLGAGDAFLAITAPLVKAGMPINQVGFIGNVMGALKVAQPGQAKITKNDLLAAITSLLK